MYHPLHWPGAILCSGRSATESRNGEGNQCGNHETLTDHPPSRTTRTPRGEHSSGELARHHRTDPQERHRAPNTERACHTERRESTPDRTDRTNTADGADRQSRVSAADAQERIVRRDRPSGRHDRQYVRRNDLERAPYYCRRLSENTGCERASSTTSSSVEASLIFQYFFVTGTERMYSRTAPTDCAGSSSTAS